VIGTNCEVLISSHTCLNPFWDILQWHKPVTIDTKLQVFELTLLLTAFIVQNVISNKNYMQHLLLLIGVPCNFGSWKTKMSWGKLMELPKTMMLMKLYNYTNCRTISFKCSGMICVMTTKDQVNGWLLYQC